MIYLNFYILKFLIDMKQFFFRKSFIQFKVFLAIIIALILFFFDYKYNTFSKIKFYLNTVVNPFFILVNNLQKVLCNTFRILVQNKYLIVENENLKKKILFIHGKVLLFDFLKKENKRLNELLNSPIKKDEYIMVAKVLLNAKNIYKSEIIINKGILNGVYNGQSVINDKGIIGQVIKVNKFNSHILLICDINHSLPVQILSNDIRAIANGIGCNRDLKLKFISNNIKNINIGDVILTSGLDGRFPEGYPVGFISSIKKKNNNYSVYGKHYIDLSRLRYLLLLWTDSKKKFLSSYSQMSELDKNGKLFKLE